VKVSAAPQEAKTIRRSSVFLRALMQWDDSPNASFCPEDVQAWLPVNPDHKTRNVAAQLAALRSMLNFVRHLLRLRRDNRTLQRRSYRTLSDAGRDAARLLCLLSCNRRGVSGRDFTD
jgi:glycosidase